jgi:hypothetical protein
MVFPSGPEIAQEASASLLSALIRVGHPFPAAVRSLLGGLPAETVGASARLAHVDAELGAYVIPTWP